MPDRLPGGAQSVRSHAARFFRYELRTTDIDAARGFYADVLGSRFEDPALAVARLPDAVRAQGAPAHWLGHVSVPDPEGAGASMAAAGGTHLGPVERCPDGTMRAVVRDPYGAVVAVASAPRPSRGDAVPWHVLNVEDHEGAFAFYAGLFGWAPTEAPDAWPGPGRHRSFAWTEGGRSVGSVADTARLPEIHPHWLFLFGVADVAHAVQAVRRLGGIVLPPFRTPAGAAAAVCEDAQGAMFGVHETTEETT